MVIGNGFGKFMGSTQVNELGELETPILLTCTRHGRGWTVLPWSALAEGNSVASDIVGIPILDDTLRRRAALCVSAAAETSLACQAVEHALVSLVRELIEGGRWRGARMRPAP